MRLAGRALLIVAAALAGCAGDSPAERVAGCGTIDWRAYGVNDGRLGVAAGARDDFFAECRARGHAPDAEAYATGRAEGLAEYCTLENGYEVGRDGRRYRDVCPPGQEVAFLQGYEEGRRDRRRSYRVYPRFGFGFGFGHFRPHHHWWFGHHHRFGW